MYVGGGEWRRNDGVSEALRRRVRKRVREFFMGDSNNSKKVTNYSKKVTLPIFYAEKNPEGGFPTKCRFYDSGKFPEGGG